MPSRRVEEPKFMETCFLCRRRFQFGPHIYAGRRVLTWDIMICETCDKSNHDSIVVGHFPHLEKYLAEKGIALPINAKGHIAIPPRW